MKKLLLAFFATIGLGHITVAQWTGQSSSSDLTSAISRTGSLSLTGTGSFLTLTSRYNGGSNGNILFQNGSNQNLILAETAADNWTIGYGLTPGSVPTPIISWNTSKNVTFGGNVGIGTTSPAFNLDVQGFGTRIKNTSTTLNTYTTFRIQGPDYTNGLEIDFFGNNNISSDPVYSYNGGAGSAAIINVNAKPLVFGTGNQARMLIDASGYVGIGTSSPQSLLHINSTLDARKTFRVYWNNDLSKYLSIWQGTGGAVIDPIGTGVLQLGYDQSTTVSVNGAMGIGTTNPGSYKLAVEGKIGAREVNVISTNPGQTMSSKRTTNSLHSKKSKTTSTRIGICLKFLRQRRWKRMV